MRLIVGLAKTVGLKVVAEGIETRAQLDMLREIGCDLGQGYYFAAPMDVDADWITPRVDTPRAGLKQTRIPRRRTTSMRAAATPSSHALPEVTRFRRARCEPGDGGRSRPARRHPRRGSAKHSPGSGTDAAAPGVEPALNAALASIDTIYAIEHVNAYIADVASPVEVQEFWEKHGELPGFAAGT